MRILAMIAAGAIVVGASMNVQAAPLSPAGISKPDTAPIMLVQDKKKDETMTQKVKRDVKRAWKRMVGYKFSVSCLTSKTTCTETGKDREVARGKCQAAHPLCIVNDAK
jgi:hypothetical protein